MPYGTVRPETREHILLRAHQSGIDVSKFTFEPSFDFEDDPTVNGGVQPDDLYEFSVIYGGALDESFYMLTDVYEVNIADWIAELLRTESEADADHGDWSVIVTEYAYEDAGVQRYRVDSVDPS